MNKLRLGRSDFDGMRTTSASGFHLGTGWGSGNSSVRALTQGGTRDRSCAGKGSCPFPIFMWKGYQPDLAVGNHLAERARRGGEVSVGLVTPAIYDVSRDTNVSPCYPEDILIKVDGFERNHIIDNRLPTGASGNEEIEKVPSWIKALQGADIFLISDILRKEGLTESAFYTGYYKTFYPEVGANAATHAYLNRVYNRKRWKNSRLFQVRPDWMPVTQFHGGGAASNILRVVGGGFLSKIQSWASNPLNALRDAAYIAGCVTTGGGACAAGAGIALAGLVAAEAGLDPRQVELLLRMDYRGIGTTLDAIQQNPTVQRGTELSLKEFGKASLKLGKTGQALFQRGSAIYTATSNLIPNNPGVVSASQFYELLNRPQIIRYESARQVHGTKYTEGECGADLFAAPVEFQVDAVVANQCYRQVRDLLHAIQQGRVSPPALAQETYLIARSAYHLVTGKDLPLPAAIVQDARTLAVAQRWVNTAQQQLTLALRARGVLTIVPRFDIKQLAPDWVPKRLSKTALVVGGIVGVATIAAALAVG